MQERRRYVRLNINLEVIYSLEGEKIRYTTMSKNISPNGARFLLEKEVPADSILNLEVKIPTSDEPIPIKAKVVWSKKRTEQGKNIYDTGLEFVQIPEESTTVFFQYLCNLMYDQLRTI